MHHVALKQTICSLIGALLAAGKAATIGPTVTRPAKSNAINRVGFISCCHCDGNRSQKKLCHSFLPASGRYRLGGTGHCPLDHASMLRRCYCASFTALTCDAQRSQKKLRFKFIWFTLCTSSATPGQIRSWGRRGSGASGKRRRRGERGGKENSSFFPSSFLPVPSPSAVVFRSPQWPARPTIRPWVSEDALCSDCWKLVRKVKVNSVPCKMAHQVPCYAVQQAFSTRDCLATRRWENWAAFCGAFRNWNITQRTLRWPAEVSCGDSYVFFRGSMTTCILRQPFQNWETLLFLPYKNLAWTNFRRKKTNKQTKQKKKQKKNNSSEYMWPMTIYRIVAVSLIWIRPQWERSVAVHVFCFWKKK